MNTTEIVKEYYLSKNRIEILTSELKLLDKTSGFIKTAKYGHESNGRVELEDIYIKWLDKRRDLEIQIALDNSLILRIDRVLQILKQDFNQIDNEIFYGKYFKNEKLAYLSVKYEYSESGLRKRIKKVSSVFEELVNL